MNFSQCRFIKENMWFYTFEDFYKNKAIIKKMFKQMNQDGKLFYCYYVYANVNIKETLKNAIWDYLNFDDIYYDLELSRLRRIDARKHNYEKK